jgi:hypothetical protein
MQRRTLAAAVLLLGASIVNPSVWAVDFSNGELSVSLPNDWEMDSSDQYGTYFNSRDKAEQLVVSSMAIKAALPDAELRRVIEALVESRSSSMKSLAKGAEPKVDKKLVEVKNDSGSAVLRGLFPVQSVFFDIRIVAIPGKMHTISYYTNLHKD